MRVATIKLREAAISVRATTESGLRRRLLNFFIAGLAALAFLYVLFLGEMVFNIVGRESLNSQARVLGNQVSQLELGYLSASQKIDLSYSHSLGFQEVAPEYATRKALGSIQIPNNEL